MKRMDLSQMNAGGKKKKKSHYGNSQKYLMTLKVQRIKLETNPNIEKTVTIHQGM